MSLWFREQRREDGGLKTRYLVYCEATLSGRVAALRTEQSSAVSDFSPPTLSPRKALKLRRGARRYPNMHLEEEKGLLAVCVCCFPWQGEKRRGETQVRRREKKGCQGSKEFWCIDPSQEKCSVAITSRTVCRVELCWRERR